MRQCWRTVADTACQGGVGFLGGGLTAGAVRVRAARLVPAALTLWLCLPFPAQGFS